MPYIGTNVEPLSAFLNDTIAFANYASLDYDTLHNGNVSIRVGPDYVRGTREVDGAWQSVNPGDHIYFAVWVKTTFLSSSEPYPAARIGMDFYASSSLGYGVPCYDAAGHEAAKPSEAEMISGYDSEGGGPIRLPWGNDWTLLVWDLHIPTDYFTYVYTTVGGVTQVYSCDPVQINSMTVWLDARAVTDNAYCWFADPVLYINPSGGNEVRTVTDVIGDMSYNNGSLYGVMIGYPVTATASGTLASVGINVPNAIGNLRVAIYSTYSGGVFSGLLGQSNSISAIAGWNNLSIPGNVAITQGVTYYICVQSDSNPGYYYALSGTQYYIYQAFGVFTDPSSAVSETTSTANMQIIYAPLPIIPPTPPAPLAIITQQSIANTGVLAGVGIQISPTSIDWGVIVPGALKTILVQIINRSTVPQTLHMTVTTWGLAQAQPLLTCTWNRENTVLNPNATTTATLILTAAASTKGDTPFSFSISITGAA